MGIGMPLQFCVCVMSHKHVLCCRHVLVVMEVPLLFGYMACVTDGRCCMQCVEACLTCCAFSASSLSCSLCSQSSSRFNAARRACARNSSPEPPLLHALWADQSKGSNGSLIQASQDNNANRLQVTYGLQLQLAGRTAIRKAQT